MRYIYKIINNCYFYPILCLLLFDKECFCCCGRKINRTEREREVRGFFKEINIVAVVVIAVVGVVGMVIPV